MFATSEEAREALSYSGKYIGARYVELFPTSENDMKYSQTSNSVQSAFRVVRLRGMHFSCQQEDICAFFYPAIVQRTDFVTLPDGTHNGEVFVEFRSDKDAKEALRKNRKKLGDRTVNMVITSDAERTTVLQMMSDAANFTSIPHVVRLRGLPFTCTEMDVAVFFQGLNIVAGGIHLIVQYDNTPTGEALVEFKYAADVCLALKKHRQHITHRYVEVYACTEEDLKLMQYICEEDDDETDTVMFGGTECLAEDEQSDAFDTLTECEAASVTTYPPVAPSVTTSTSSKSQYYVHCPYSFDLATDTDATAHVTGDE